MTVEKPEQAAWRRLELFGQTGESFETLRVAHGPGEITSPAPDLGRRLGEVCERNDGRRPGGRAQEQVSQAAPVSQPTGQQCNDTPEQNREYRQEPGRLEPAKPDAGGNGLQLRGYVMKKLVEPFDFPDQLVRDKAGSHRSRLQKAAAGAVA